MGLFKILKGDSSRISTEITPFHEGWAYFTPDNGGLYIDADENGQQMRIRVSSPSEASLAVSCTLLADAWENGQQRLPVEGLTEQQNGIIGTAQDITPEQLQACWDGELYVCGQGDGYLDIALNGDIPACDIPVAVILLA